MPEWRRYESTSWKGQQIFSAKLSKFPGIVTRKSIRNQFCWEDLLNFAQLSRNIHKKCLFKKFPGISTRKSIDFWVLVPRSQFISRSQDPEIYWFPGLVTWESLRKKPNFVNISAKTKILLSWISPRIRKYLRVCGSTRITHRTYHTTSTVSIVQWSTMVECWLTIFKDGGQAQHSIRDIYWSAAIVQ